jgi:hypothetical protein
MGKEANMPNYQVQLSRTIRLTFTNVHAGTASDAALLADGRAKDLLDCVLARHAASSLQRGGSAKPGALLALVDEGRNVECVVDQLENGVPVVVDASGGALARHSQSDKPDARDKEFLALREAPWRANFGDTQIPLEVLVHGKLCGVLYWRTGGYCGYLPTPFGPLEQVCGLDAHALRNKVQSLNLSNLARSPRLIAVA